MSYEIEADYEKQWLFPPSLEELLGKDHPARMVREFVAGLELEALGFKVRKSDDGRPSYSSSLLLKVWLYGYMTKNRSNRALERACLDQVGMLWLTGMNSPDHTTLWRFWRDNRAAIRKVFKQLLQVAASMDLVGMVLHAVDGTKILSQASKYKAWHRSTLEGKLKTLDKAIDEIMKETEQTSGEQPADCRLPEELQQKEKLRQRIQDQLRQLREQQRDHLNPGDEDARMTKCREGKKFAYNAQAVVDEQTQLFVAVDVVTDESDNYQLVPMLEKVEENLGRVAEQTAADAGYKATRGLAEAEQKHYSVLVNLAEPETEPYHASRFIYDAQNDQCICPRGELLRFAYTLMRDKVEPYQVRAYRCGSYETCPVRWQCSSSKKGRTVHIHPDNDALVRQREKLKDQNMRALLKKRGQVVEPVFGWCKEAMGFRRCTVRGLEKVKTQWYLLCTAINFVRLHPYWVAGRLAFN